jgi:drug/metabolite transporter (DMT)-like permease
MRASDVWRLVILSAIWGGSFIFMRIIAPVLGPVLTADLRVLIAGVVLLAYFRLTGFAVDWRRRWRHYLVIGAVNSGLPFCLYAFAARHIPAAYSAILNSTAPLFGAVFSALWLADRLTPRKIAGLVMGAAGVGLVAGVSRTGRLDGSFGWAVGACLLAAVCYALAGVYIKRFASGIPPRAVAGASQMAAGLLLLPILPLAPPNGAITLFLAANVLGLSLLCSAAAYLLYYRLIVDVGPTRALTVTFLMPLFGMLWGVLFLGEAVSLAMAAGCALIVGGTVLVLKRSGREAGQIMLQGGGGPVSGLVRTDGKSGAEGS